MAIDVHIRELPDANRKYSPHEVLGARSTLLGMLLSFIVKFESDFRIQSYPKIVVHNTLFLETVPVIPWKQLIMGPYASPIIFIPIIENGGSILNPTQGNIFNQLESRPTSNE